MVRNLSWPLGSTMGTHAYYPKENGCETAK